MAEILTESPRIDDEQRRSEAVSKVKGKPAADEGMTRKCNRSIP